MKISIIGAGNVGSTTAQRLAEQGYYDIVLHDIANGLAEGKALDIYQSAPITEHDVRISGTTDYRNTAGSDLVIVTAGASRRPGIERSELLRINAGIVREVIEQVTEYSPHTSIIMVTNPVEAMTYLALAITGWERERVIGLSGVLDSARFAGFIATECRVPPSAVKTIVIGEHGTHMLPLPRLSTVSRRALSDILPPEKIACLVQKTINAGSQIVQLIKTSSAYYAPAAALQRMAEAILLNKKEVLPVSAYLTGEYGLEDCVITVPARLGEKGIEEIIELELTPHEKESLCEAAAAVRTYSGALDDKPGKA